MSEYRTEQNEPSCEAVKLLPRSNRDKIIFQLSRSDRRGFTLIEVDVSKLDAAWRASGENYIWPDGRGAIEGRIDRFAAWLAAHPGEPINASWVYMNASERVAFADGRHRFALLRDRGYGVIKIAVRKKQARTFRKLFSPTRPKCRSKSLTKKAISSGTVHSVRADLRKVLTSDPAARAKWEDITPLARNEWICWVISVKKPETRRQHIERVRTELKEGIRRPCCWPGCPHR